MGTSRKAIPYTDRHKGRGAEYHETFSPEVNPYRAMVWRLEQRALDRLLRKHLPSSSINHLDFACGTGRIVEYLMHRVSHTTGVDVSSSMLEVARKVAPTAELIEADLTQNDVLGNRSFDLVTAFRFFPNAEPPLRQAVLSALSRHLAPNGVLIFNNHKNRNSLRARIVRLRGRGSVVGTMSHQDVEALLPTAGLRLVEMIPVASLPLSEKHVFLPVGVAEAVEKMIGGWSALSGIAQDILYVCAPGSTPQHQSNSSFSH